VPDKSFNADGVSLLYQDGVLLESDFLRTRPGDLGAVIAIGLFLGWTIFFSMRLNSNNFMWRLKFYQPDDAIFCVK